jgi:hypothetical protein
MKRMGEALQNQYEDKGLTNLGFFCKKHSPRR